MSPKEGPRGPHIDVLHEPQRYDASQFNGSVLGDINIPAIYRRSSQPSAVEVASPDEVREPTPYDNQLLELFSSGFAHDLAVRMRVDDFTAWDISQDSFLRAWNSVGKSFKGGDLKKWTGKVVANIVRDMRRANQRKIRNFNPVDPEDTDLHLDLAPSPYKNTDDDAIDTLQRLEIGEIIENALKEIPEEQRDVFVAIEVLEAPYGRTAEFFEIPPGTVKSRVARAKEKIRNRLTTDELARKNALVEQFVDRMEMDSTFSDKDPQEDKN